jgi:hypothetical protein
MPERHEERREQYQQPYYNQPYQGNQVKNGHPSFLGLHFLQLQI